MYIVSNIIIILQTVTDTIDDETIESTGDEGICIGNLVIPFRGFWFEILEKAILYNEKVFGVSAKTIGVNSMLYNVNSLGFKRVERLVNSMDVEHMLRERVKSSKNFKDGMLTINLAFGRGKVGNLITGDFMLEPPDPEEVIVGYSPARKKKNSEISQDSRQYPSE